MEKISKLHTERAGGGLAGGLAGGYYANKFLKDLSFAHKIKGLPPLSKTFKAGIMLPTVAAGVGAGVLVGKGLDALLTKKEASLNKAEATFLKVAQTMEDNRTYPISRAWMTLANVEGATVPGRIHRRAAQGRKNLGQEGITSSEKQLLSKMKKEDNGKSYPISRALTSVPLSSGIGGVYGATVGGFSAARLGKSKGVIGAAALGAGVLGAGLNAASQTLGRHIYSRAQIGRAKKGREGWTAKDKELMTTLRNSEEKTAGILNVIRSGIKAYGKNVAGDAKALWGAGKEGLNLSKQIGAQGGNATFGQLRKARQLSGVKNKAMVGLAGRVGLPGVVGYNMLSGDE